MLSFQRLDVYQRSIQFLALASELVEELPRGNAERADQLIRAAEAVPRNIAEGAGRWSKVDMSKHYKIARGEAMECAASLDVLKVRRLIEQPRYERGIELLEAVVAMLAPGDFFGEGALTGQLVRIGTATAVVATSVLAIEKTR